jgi:phosphoribosylformylglycinamidine synthase
LYNETRGEGIYPTPVLGIVGVLDDVTKAVPADFQQEGDAILLLWPIPRGEDPNPDLKVPFQPAPINPYIISGLVPDPPFPIASPGSSPVSDEEIDTTETPAVELAAFGGSEYAKVMLGQLWGTPPPLDLDAEANLHKLLAECAWRNLVTSARDLSDGGIAVALAQSAIRSGIGASVDQEQSLLPHPLFGLFAEPASRVLLTAKPGKVPDVERLSSDYGFFVATIGVTGKRRLEIRVDKELFISAGIDELREPWATALEASLHNEVTA